MGTPRIANKRLGNNVRDALDDIVMICKGLDEPWKDAQEWAEEGLDAVMLGHLGRLRNGVALIERKARAARLGKYE